MPSVYISTPFIPGCFYHLYNTGNNNELIFRKARDYNFFLKKFNEIAGPYVDVFAWCLLPDHFHLLLKIKNHPDFDESFTPSAIFRIFFLQYAVYFNQTNNRQGNVFNKCVKRIKIENESSLLSLVHYIHSNPQFHNFTTNFKYHYYSSYHSLVYGRSSPPDLDPLKKLFKYRIEDFKKYHRSDIEYRAIIPLLIE